MLARNKWNGAMYDIISKENNTVVLEILEDKNDRRKGERFTISFFDFGFNYIILDRKSSKSC